MFSMASSFNQDLSSGVLPASVTCYAYVWRAEAALPRPTSI